jgi:hypothetical protein
MEYQNGIIQYSRKIFLPGDACKYILKAVVATRPPPMARIRDHLACQGGILLLKQDSLSLKKLTLSINARKNSWEKSGRSTTLHWKRPVVENKKKFRFLLRNIPDLYLEEAMPSPAPSKKMILLCRATRCCPPSSHSIFHVFHS